ncbi:hypothetical protein EJ08DRAFT_732721 [Tothia fuscella]|uniref:Uncharacterized protein n=1 Tax=Tothia fuscella TaxID=1048955 RepID=A0A9P4U0J7_9PEZI|nr:hypothetical protein EJ08DRAFT_732721 [Tothia fuscella]
MDFLKFSLATTVTRIAGIASSGIFAGYTLALSDAAVPAILVAKDEVTLAQQWRVQYLKGFTIAIPATIINILSWGFLAYTSHNFSNPLPMQLFTTAAITTGSGTVFAWTALRHINGALSIRTEKLAGPGTTGQHMAMTYSKNEKWSKETEAKYETRELIMLWERYNRYRAWILVVGTIVGGVGLAML